MCLYASVFCECPQLTVKQFKNQQRTYTLHYRENKWEESLNSWSEKAENDRFKLTAVCTLFHSTYLNFVSLKVLFSKERRGAWCCVKSLMLFGKYWRAGRSCKGTVLRDRFRKCWQKSTDLGHITRAAAGFWIFQRHLWFLVEIKHLLSGKC